MFVSGVERKAISPESALTVGVVVEVVVEVISLFDLWFNILVNNVK